MQMEEFLLIGLSLICDAFFRRLEGNPTFLVPMVESIFVAWYYKIQ